MSERERVQAIQDELADMLIRTMGGRFTDEEQAHYDALHGELDRLDPPSAAAEMRRAGAPGLWDGEGT